MSRYEDNFDAVNNLTVIKEKTDKSKIEDYGSPEEFLQRVSYVLGKQSFDGKCSSAGTNGVSKKNTCGRAIGVLVYTERAKLC